jgi:hypothetical protein
MGLVGPDDSLPAAEGPGTLSPPHADSNAKSIAHAALMMTPFLLNCPSFPVFIAMFRDSRV